MECDIFYLRFARMSWSGSQLKVDEGGEADPGSNDALALAIIETPETITFSTVNTEAKIDTGTCVGVYGPRRKVCFRRGVVICFFLIVGNLYFDFNYMLNIKFRYDEQTNKFQTSQQLYH